MVALQNVLTNTVWTAALVLRQEINPDHARKYTYRNFSIERLNVSTSTSTTLIKTPPPSLLVIRQHWGEEGAFPSCCLPQNESSSETIDMKICSICTYFQMSSCIDQHWTADALSTRHPWFLTPFISIILLFVCFHWAWEAPLYLCLSFFVEHVTCR